MRLSSVVLALLTFTTACGQDAPTCASDCAALVPTRTTALDPRSPASTCASTCESDQATAATNGKAADFQYLLTCVGNAGSFAPECASLACSLTDAFGTPSGCSEPAAGH
jgi:hypothetical protein